MRTTKASLKQPTFLARGGFSQVFRADGFHLPGDPTPLAYKEFTVARADQARSAVATVAFRDGLSEKDRTELDFSCAWPRAIVEDSTGVVSGLLMPLLSPEFFCNQLDPDTGELTARPREMSWLIASAAQRAAAQIDLPDIDRTDRLLLLAQLVYTVARLHRYGWVFGDLSFKNAAFALNPPRLMLMDCDGAAALADASRKQSSTPFWDPPECPITPLPGQQVQQRLQDTVTDTYKLGLAILRCLTPGRGAATSRAIGRLAGELDTEGTNLVARALSADRANRPAAKDLYSYLEQLVSQLTAPPSVIHAKLITPFRLRSQDVRIEWQIDNALEVEISVGDTHAVKIDLALHPNGIALPLGEADSVSIRARNRFGLVNVDLGKLTFFERSPLEANISPVDVDINRIPRSQINALEEYLTDPKSFTFMEYLEDLVRSEKDRYT